MTDIRFDIRFRFANVESSPLKTPMCWKKMILILPLLVLFVFSSACTDEPENPPFTELLSRVEAVLHSDEREAYFALHYDDLLREGQIGFPEDYIALSGAEKAEEWKASLDTAADYEATLLLAGKGASAELQKMVESSIPAGFSSNGITFAELSCLEEGGTAWLCFGLSAGDAGFPSGTPALKVNGAPLPCERLLLGLGTPDLNPAGLGVFRAEWPEGSPSGTSRIELSIGAAIFVCDCDWDAQLCRLS